MRYGRLPREEKGQALAEVALVLPVLILLLFAIIEFGRVFSAHLTVVAASREGARYGVVGATDAQIVEHVKESAAALDTSLLEVSIDPPAPRLAGDTLKVEVEYPVSLVLPLPDVLLPNPVWVHGETAMQVE